MERVCFRLQVKTDRLDEYRQRHAAVWPEMLAALERTGWHNYSLFLGDDGLLVGYFETPSLEQALAGMAATDVNTRWQAEMAEFFVDIDVPADQGFVRLAEVFHLSAFPGHAASDLRGPDAPPPPTDSAEGASS